MILKDGAVMHLRLPGIWDGLHLCPQHHSPLLCLDVTLLQVPNHLVSANLSRPTIHPSISTLVPSALDTTPLVISSQDLSFCYALVHQSGFFDYSTLSSFKPSSDATSYFLPTPFTTEINCFFILDPEYYVNLYHSYWVPLPCSIILVYRSDSLSRE